MDNYFRTICFPFLQDAYIVYSVQYYLLLLYSILHVSVPPSSSPKDATSASTVRRRDGSDGQSVPRYISHMSHKIISRTLDG